MTAVAAPEIQSTSAVIDPTTAEQSAAKVAVERAAIDSAAAGPVLTFFTTAVGWLIVAGLLGMVSAIKLRNPNFLADYSWLTYGRVTPAYNLALTYGWASLAGMGVGIWLLSRLCRVPLRFPGLLVFGTFLWNLGLAMGIVAVLAGQNSGVEGMEIPRGMAMIMFAGYLLIGLWGAVMYRLRRSGPVFISVWYLLGAFFWFPLVFGLAQLSGAMPQVAGVVHSSVNAWYMQNLSILWFTSIGLAAIYYLIPKVINRPIFSYNLASIGFWTFAVFGGLTSMVRLSGGPVPAWLVTVSIAANIMMLIPIATVMTNFIFTMRGNTQMIAHSPTIRFTYFGAIAFAVSSLLALISSLRSVDRVVHFTQFQAGQHQLLIYAFFSMVMFGAIYYITPRLVGCEWLSSTLIKIHFWGTAYGGGLMICMLLFSGLATGWTLADPRATFAQVVEINQVYLPGLILSFVFIIFSHLIFALHYLLMLVRIGQPGGEPTLFTTPGEETH